MTPRTAHFVSILAAAVLLGGGATGLVHAASIPSSAPAASPARPDGQKWAATGALVAPAPKPATRAKPPAGTAKAPSSPSPGPAQELNQALRKAPSAGDVGIAASEAAQAKGRAARKKLMGAIRTWGNQLQELDVATALKTPFDMLVVDAIGGVAGGNGLTREEVAALKVKPDGSRRVLISYLSIGEAEDYRPDYFTAEYMTEDAPDWLLNENERWKGNRLIRFCEEGWQRTILGDDDGRNVYNSVEPSPLYRLIEAGIDGVYLDRVDVYAEVEKECPDAARKMVDFVARLAAHARKANPNFVVILQNAEELLQHAKMVETIDAIAKEDLFYGADHSERRNDPGMVKTVLSHLAIARAAGKPVFILDYLRDAAKRTEDKAKIEAQGFIPYFGPRKLDHFWLP